MANITVMSVDKIIRLSNTRIPLQFDIVNKPIFQDENIRLYWNTTDPAGNWFRFEVLRQGKFSTAGTVEKSNQTRTFFGLFVNSANVGSNHYLANNSNMLPPAIFEPSQFATSTWMIDFLPDGGDRVIYSCTAQSMANISPAEYSLIVPIMIYEEKQ